MNITKIKECVMMGKHGVLRKAVLAVLVMLLVLAMNIVTMAMPGDVGGDWNGYDSYDAWYYSVYGTYPPSNWNGDDDREVGEVTDVWWSGSTAHWDHEGHCRKFEIRLYRDGDHIATEKTSSSKYNFSDRMGREGDYTFEVRAIYGSQHSDWSDESDVHYTRGSSSHSNSHSHSGGVVTSGGPGAVSSSKWVQAADGSGRWWYRHGNGSYTANNWEQIDGSWYFFDGAGWMVTGWIHWNGNTYYCLNNGKMVTGDVVIDGQGRHFDTSGAMR